MELATYSSNRMTDFLYSKNMLRFTKPVLCFFFFFPGFLPAQKFHFQNYNVQQGLIQSQVFGITQDHYDNLWFCTLGGISRFDGKSFTNYSETDGLISNYTNSILADHDSNIWIGTAFGVSRFNGIGFKNFKLAKTPSGNVVKTLQVDGKNRIWVLAGGKLYMIDHEKVTPSLITGDNDRISTIQVDNNGLLWASLPGNGVFQLESEKWKMNIPLPEFSDMGMVQKMVFDAVHKNRVFLLTPTEIFSSDQGEINPFITGGDMGKFINMYQDKSNKLWFTCSQGLYQYSDSGLTAYNSNNGFEGSGTNIIFQDKEYNIWLGTNGTGAFRYSYQPFLIYDQFTATRNTAIMPMLENRDHIYFGSDGAGLFMYDGKVLTPVKGVSDNPQDQHISGLFQGRDNEIWILTSSELLLKYANGKMTKVSLGDSKGCIYDVLPDDQGGFWAASCSGFLYISSSGKTTRVMDGYSNRILSLSKDSVLVSTDVGLYLVGKDFKYRKINDSVLSASNYMAMSSIGKYYLLATSNKGFIIYNSANGSRKQLTTKDGLNADFIYSVATDHKNRIWLGTGRGINKIVFDSATEGVQVSSLSIPGDISSAECNQEAAVYDSKDNLWVGTVSGLFKYFPDSGKKKTYLPPVVLQQVQVFSKEISPKRYSGLVNNWYDIPKDLVLPHDENHLTFTFRCPSYLHSESILYQYQLEGMEKTYSALTPNHFVVYPALPPGHYTFRARAFVEGSGYSNNNAAFSFDISAAFYQTLYFKFLVLVLAIALILWIQWFRIRMRVKQLRRIEEVKRDENIKVRQTASEDFHDEVGNSLTRMQVLTDVLYTKLGSGHDEEKRIIGQIKENISGLYQGTRDILWALNPESDIIKEIGQRLESLGVDVFQDTGVCFSYENMLGESENVKLPGNFNRNIMMIFKEAMSNSLKHAQARHVKLNIQRTEQGEIQIELADDGIGFNHLFVKKGHGFQNMLKRANRIKSKFNIITNPGTGTRYDLNIPLVPA
jgi:signal transduction histidine kinase/ligand-binding sensor domain-containing protein